MKPKIETLLQAPPVSAMLHCCRSAKALRVISDLELEGLREQDSIRNLRSSLSP